MKGASREGEKQGDRVRVPLVALRTARRAEEPKGSATLDRNPGLICSPRGRQSDFQTQLLGLRMLQPQLFYKITLPLHPKMNMGRRWFASQASFQSVENSAQRQRIPELKDRNVTQQPRANNVNTP